MVPDFEPTRALPTRPPAAGLDAPSTAIFVRVPRDDKLIQEVEKEVTAFLAEVNFKVSELTKETE